MDIEIESSIDTSSEVELETSMSTTPSGPAAAAESFAWMNRQLTWQSILADLEVVAWLTDGDAARSGDGTSG
jgi:hypothetical protein